MRIVEDTPSQLRLRDRTLWISLVFLAAAAFVAGNVLLHHGPAKGLIAAAVTALLPLAFLRATDATFDKAARTCRISRLDVFRVTRRSLGFAEIADVRVEIAMGEADQRAPLCRLTLATADGDIPLTVGYEPGLARYNAMRDAILAVVRGAASRAEPVDPVRALAQAGRLIDAVSLLRQRDGLDLKTAKDRVDAMRDGKT